MFAAILLVALAGHPTAALATPQAPEGLAEITAERNETLAELAFMKDEFDERVAEYVALGRRIGRVQAEVIEVQAELDEVDAELRFKERALKDRVVNLYRTDKVGVLEVLLDSKNLQDLFARMQYLAIISERDSRLVSELRVARSESMWLQQTLLERVDILSAMQEEADTQRESIEAEIAEQELKAQELGQDIARLMRPVPRPQAASSGQRGEFDPYLIISDAVFRDSSAMTAEEIQAFLDRQPGVLKQYQGPDYQGETKTAAVMIAEAAEAWGVNPEVILVKLQKEQSLLGRANPSQTALDWAMGCGKTDSKTLTKYRGFGKQIWFGAASLDKNARRWKPGVVLTITGNQIAPENASTFALYKYTPHLAGNMSFWMLYWRYFGDPVAESPVPAAP